MNAPTAQEKLMSAVPQKEEMQSMIVVGERSFSRPEERALQTQQPAPANLMQALAAAAADPRMDVEKVERLYAMLKEMMQREAEAAFNDAMARAQEKMEPIIRDRRNEHTKSWYATLAAINEVITPIHTAEGLSVTYDSYKPEFDKDGKEINPPREGWFRTIGICAHKGGFSRRYHIDLPLDDAGKDGTKNKTGVQAMGSTNAYARRYLKTMIFDLSTADDDDGNGGGTDSRMDEKKIADHLAALDAASDEPSLLKAFGMAWNAAEDVKDKNAQRLLIQHRDARRKAMRGAR